jgi:hypothetical protein
MQILLIFIWYQIILIFSHIFYFSWKISKSSTQKFFRCFVDLIIFYYGYFTALLKQFIIVIKRIKFELNFKNI